MFFPETFNLARKAAIIAAEDQPIDINIEIDYEKQRKRQLSVRFIQSSDDENSEKENKCIKRKRKLLQQNPVERCNVQRTKRVKISLK